ncbi:MAG: hypothetical protein GEU75_08425 [Dehalococcoidia bacterium]|nr:hypothetical protein [Dehalococcoidia bacterium]
MAELLPRLRLFLITAVAGAALTIACSGDDEEPVLEPAVIVATSTPGVRPTSPPDASPTPPAQAQSRTAFRFGSGVAPEDRAYMQAGIDLAVDYMARAAGIDPVKSTLYAYPHPELLRIALTDDIDNPLLIDAAVRRLAVIPAEAHLGGLILVSPSTAEWQARSSVSRIRVVAHEYFHLVQMQLLGHVAERIASTPVDRERPEGPSWLFEGSADWVSWQALESAELSSLDGYLASVTVPNDVDIAGLETFIEYYHAGEDRALLPLVAVDLLVRDDVRSLTRFYESVGRGLPWREAFSAAFGRPVPSFYAELREELAGR